MSRPAEVFTIERTTAPTFRLPDGQEPRRFLGHDNDGRLVWAGSLKIANTYPTARDAESFRRNRMGDSEDAQVVRHSVH